MTFLTQKDIDALDTFGIQYPTWWWKLGYCDLTRDFDCAPQAHSPEMALSKQRGDVWDAGFSCDHTGSFADAIYDVMRQIEEAKKR